MASGNLARVEESLRRRFRVVETAVQVGDREVRVLHPESAEDLISEADFERDERLPYWAELWPSARVLGEHLLSIDGGGRSLIELGCGAGLASTCAALAGFDVTVTDYYDDAVRFARVNARHNGTRVSHGFMLDWRSLPDETNRFDVVVASDVLYERSYGPLVAQAIRTFLAPGGVALLADPGRVAREEFEASLEPLGLEVRRLTDCPFVEDAVRQTITIFEIGRGKKVHRSPRKSA